jgi:hypothetical protein
MVPPPAFMLLTNWLGLRPALSRTWWPALGRTDAPAAVSLRTAVLLVDAAPRAMDPRHLIHHVWAPARLVSSVETCVEHGALTRQQAVPLEEAILRWTSAAGHWT